MSQYRWQLPIHSLGPTHSGHNECHIIAGVTMIIDADGTRVKQCICLGLSLGWPRQVKVFIRLETLNVGCGFGQQVIFTAFDLVPDANEFFFERDLLVEHLQDVSAEGNLRCNPA